MPERDPQTIVCNKTKTASPAVSRPILGLKKTRLIRLQFEANTIAIAPPFKMASVVERDDHFGVRPHCGLCNASMSISEDFFLLLGSIDSTSFFKCLGPFVFPAHGHFLRSKDGVYLCRKQGCGVCARSAEASTVHSDCFRLVVRRCELKDVINYLWIITAWRSPWRQAPYLRLEEMVITSDLSVADELGMPQMRLLPPEVLHIIYRYSLTSLIWRYCVVSDLARNLRPLSDKLVSVPLNKISAWTRGSQLEIAQDSYLSITRLTIDSYGIKKIESLSAHPEFKSWRSDYRVYIILDRGRIDGIIAHLKGGRIRLQLPRAYRGLQMWDTPSPPKLERCIFYPDNITQSTRFKLIDLSRVFGLTFFFCDGQIYDVHAHTILFSCAQSTYQHLSNRRQSTVTWVYAPISREDYIAAMGICMSRAENHIADSICLLLRMRLAGDVPVGLTACKPAPDLLLCKTPPKALIYNVEELRPVSVFGTFTTDSSPTCPISPFHKPAIGTPPFADALYSTAPLKDVEVLDIFNHAETGYCIGILLKYKDGAQRSLGQCRLGVDSVERYYQPERICRRQLQLNSEPRKRTRNSASIQLTMVKAASHTGHHHSEEGWTCFAMHGELEFWFSCDETDLVVIVD